MFGFQFFFLTWFFFLFNFKSRFLLFFRKLAFYFLEKLFFLFAFRQFFKKNLNEKLKFFLDVKLLDNLVILATNFNIRILFLKIKSVYNYYLSNFKIGLNVNILHFFSFFLESFFFSKKNVHSKEIVVDKKLKGDKIFKKVHNLLGVLKAVKVNAVRKPKYFSSQLLDVFKNLNGNFKFFFLDYFFSIKNNYAVNGFNFRNSLYLFFLIFFDPLLFRKSIF